MKLTSLPDCHLSYCTNIHAGESWGDVERALKRYLPEIRRKVCPHQTMGIGLRLSALAARQLWENMTLLQVFKEWLELHHFYVFTLNGFPFGRFHGQPLKTQVYQPDWSAPERLEYSRQLAEILAQLLSEEQTGSISTLPIGFKPHFENPVRLRDAINHLLELVAYLVQLEARSGKWIQFALEPEPGCYLETTQGTIAFFRRYLFSESAVAYLKSVLPASVSAKADVELVRRHLGVCLDTCHAAVMFESPLIMARSLTESNIAIYKLQLTAALEVNQLTPSARERLLTFSDEIYLHQTSVQMQGKRPRRRFYLDLYPADGRKIADIYTAPAQIRTRLNGELGRFPLFNFWGPKAGIQSSQWIVNAALKTLDSSRPDLAMVYLPHLDYCLQKLGPGHPEGTQELKQIDALCGDLIDYGKAQGYTVVVLSEYGITEVDGVCHINRLFRRQGWLAVRKELGRELLDAGASRVFAVADHQIAHIYIQDKNLMASVRRLLERQVEVDSVLDEQNMRDYSLNHARSGELIAVAKPNAWFSYYYWLEDERAPDFAHTVDIHRKPGYDPVELFIDPGIRLPMAALGWRLLKKKLGFRTLMDVIPLDTALVKGSHGAWNKDSKGGAIFICSEAGILSVTELSEGVAATKIKNVLLDFC